MDDAAYLRSIDRHLANSERLMERLDRTLDRNEKAFDRNTEAFDRNSEAFDRNTEAFERNSRVLDRVEASLGDQRQFMHETILRVQKIGEEEMRRLEAHTNEVVQEMRAQRGALLAILDRLNPGGPNAPA